MNPDRCPACDEPAAPTATECPLCGAFLRSRDEAAIRAQTLDISHLPLDAADEFLAAFLTGAELRGAFLAGADLFHADLHGADLRGADLAKANLSAANLAHADLSGANLWNADLSEANLCGADLSDANLRRADLHGAQYDLQTLFPSDFDPIAAGALYVQPAK